MNELRDQLWDFVYGLLDEADAAKLRERITSDRQIAREYARVKLQSELLAQAARANPSERELPTLPERPGTAPSRLSGVRLVVFSGSLALSLGLLLFAGVMYWSDGTALRGPAVAQALEAFEQAKHPRLIVTGPQVLEPEADNTYDITVQSLSGESLNAPVTASLEDLDGNQLWYESSETGLDGKHTLELPADKLHGGAVRLKIEVDAAATNGPEVAPLDTWLSIQKPRGELSVVNRVSDGENVYFREAEIRMLDRSDFSESVDKSAESSRSESMQRYKSRLEDRVSLTEEAERVRWGRERFGQLGIESQFNDRPAAQPAAEPKDKKSQSGDSVKQLHEALPGAPKKSIPARGPVASGQPGADFRSDPSPKRPAPAPRDAQPSPGKLDEIASGKKESPRQQTDAVDAPALAPTARPSELSSAPAADADEPDPVKLGKSHENGRQILLESVTANEKLLASRMVDGTQPVTTLQQRIDDLRQEGKIDDKFTGRIELSLYDPAVAPPQKVAQSSVEIRPAIEPLNCTVRFDRAEYYEGQLVTAELQVTDSNNQPLSAVLNVQVDAIPLSESDADSPPAPAQYLFTKAESPLVPLIFDNASQQVQSYQQSLARKLVEQRSAQGRAALLLLGGAGVGASLLVVAGLLKWLPRARYWVPVAALLGCCGLIGMIWLPGQEPPSITPSVTPTTPLTTYGVQSQPPVTDLAGKAQPVTTPTGFESLPDRAEGLAMNEFRLPAKEQETVPTDDLTDRTRHTLFAMSEWESLAEAAEGGESTAGAATERILAKAKSFGTVFDFGYATNGFAPNWRAIPLPTPEGENSTDKAKNPPGAHTIYWHPRLTTDSAGNCRIQFPAPAGPLAHRIKVIAHGAGRLGTASEIVPTVLLLGNH